MTLRPRLVATASALFMITLTAVPPLQVEPAAQSPTVTAPTRTAIDVSRLGPQLGQIIPDFTLRDQAGKVWTRQSIMGPTGAMIVFYRSADW